MFGIGSQELLILFLVVLLLFGADRIPEVARALGKSLRDFKRAAGEIESEIQQVTRHKDLLSDGKGKKPVGRNGTPSTVKRPGGPDEGAPEADCTGEDASAKAERPGGPGETEGAPENGAPEGKDSDQDASDMSNRPG